MSINVDVTGVSSVGWVGADDSLLLETGFDLLLESGDRFILQSGALTAGWFDAIGAFATGELGSVVTEFNANVPVTGVFATTRLGFVNTRYGADVLVVGLFATGRVGRSSVWGNINTGQVPNWNTIANAQTPQWVDVI